MKKFPASLAERIGQVRLYLDDLQELIELFSGAGPTVEFTGGGYQFDSAVELAESGKATRSNLEMIVHQPFVRLTIERGEARLYRGDDSMAARGVFDAAREVLRRRRLTLRSVLTNDWTFTASMIASAPMGGAAGYLAGEGGARSAVSILLLVWLVGLFAAGICCAFRPGPAVVLVRSNDRPSSNSMRLRSSSHWRLPSLVA